MHIKVHDQLIISNIMFLKTIIKGLNQFYIKWYTV